MADVEMRAHGSAGFKGKIARNPDFELAAAQLEQMPTLKEYVAEAVLLMLDPPTWLEEVPIEYDRDTGEPTKFATRPCKFWDGILYTHAGFRSNDGINVPACICDALKTRKDHIAIFNALGKQLALVPYYAETPSGVSVLAGYKIEEVDVLD